MVEQTLDEVLEHYGIKGMKWGVRRTPEQLARARGERLAKGKPVTPTKKAKRQAKKAAKRELKKPSEDAVQAAELQKKLKKGGVAALTNQELQDLTKRMNLEQQFERLDAPKKNAGEKFVDEILLDVAKTQSKNVANQYVADMLIDKGLLRDKNKKN